ncbi:serine--tRNA ligase [Helicobacter monodelphidis]|uniref:serine--tRNA ligase n=1 Tax=Helicobacter sp. 15-1451 TaxID=2004995 RepID=UPI000DCCDA04|nr:serine--tRNA ligase [Helicobacter sp. 15-1451]RAX58229.1 serine--tRNA ligase [Helicobacter sp. 15-1451]
MIDNKLLLQNFEEIKEKLQIRGVAVSTLEQLYKVSTDYKALKQELEEYQAFQNRASKLFAEYKQKGEDTTSLKQDLEENKQKISQKEEELNFLTKQLSKLSHSIPNLPDSITPIGKDESDNVEIKKILTPRIFNFTPKEHWELATKNGWIDFEAGVKLAKSRFSVLRKMGAKINRALINMMLDYNQKAGFEMVATPVIVNAEMLFGTGQLPKFEEDMFKITSPLEEDVNATFSNDLYLISTSEITLTNLYNDTIIPKEELPIRLTAHTPCFRKEAGSAGRDTRGIIRQHQFDKVELVAITTPEQSEEMQQDMLQAASHILKDLELPHRFMQLCSGDLGFSASNTVDIEVWLPGQNCYREISSVSNTRDFQARRAKIRYKENKKNMLVHTLNGSALAVGRTLVALMENHQQEDGTINIPKALERYL